jgi:hypothetical protein
VPRMPTTKADATLGSRELRPILSPSPATFGTEASKPNKYSPDKSFCAIP